LKSDIRGALGQDFLHQEKPADEHDQHQCPKDDKA